MVCITEGNLTNVNISVVNALLRTVAGADVAMSTQKTVMTNVTVV